MLDSFSYEEVTLNVEGNTYTPQMKKQHTYLISTRHLSCVLESPSRTISAPSLQRLLSKLKLYKKGVEKLSYIHIFYLRRDNWYRVWRNNKAAESRMTTVLWGRDVMWVPFTIGATSRCLHVYLLPCLHTLWIVPRFSLIWHCLASFQLFTLLKYFICV